MNRPCPLTASRSWWYVRAGWPILSADQWAESRTLWLADSEGQSFREVTAVGRGVYNQKWARDCRHLVYIKGDAL